ncbi:MAG: CBS domain-containing protein [Eubacteriales bacterium]
MKNILFFLIPKKEVVFLNAHCSLKFALEVMEENGYSAIPLISDKGRYAGTLTEGDLLWEFKNNPDLTFENCNKFSLNDVRRRRKVKPARINEPLEEIIHMSKQQNFIPVVDDDGVFIGIIRRQEILDYLLNSNIELASV